MCAIYAFILAHLYERWTIVLHIKFIWLDLATEMKPVVHLLSFESEKKIFCWSFTTISLYYYTICVKFYGSCDHFILKSISLMV